MYQVNINDVVILPKHQGVISMEDLGMDDVNFYPEEFEIVNTVGVIGKFLIDRALYDDNDDVKKLIYKGDFMGCSGWTLEVY